MKNRFIFYALICIQLSIIVNDACCASIDPTTVALTHKKINADIIQQTCTYLNKTLAQGHASEPNVLLYNTLFDSFNKAESPIHHVSIQMLIQHLFSKAQSSPAWVSWMHALCPTLGLPTNRYALLASNMLSRYFNLNIRPNQMLTIKEALTIAATCNTISKKRLHDALQASIHTDFATSMDITNIKLQVMQDPHAPLSLRAQLLDNIFLQHIMAKQSLYDIAQQTHKLHDYPFKAYAQAFLTALDLDSSITQYCVARSCIALLAVQHPETFTENPKTLTFCYGKLFRAFQNKIKIGDNRLIQVNNEFKDTNFSVNGVCFGYAQQDMIQSPSKNYLYACDKQTGLPIWIYPQNKQLPYAISYAHNKIYCATDTNTIAVLDSNDGEILESITCDELQGAQRMELYQNRLFVLTNKSINIVNLTNKEYETISVPADAKLNCASFIDGALIIPTGQHFFIVDGTRAPQLINHYSDNQPRMYGTSTCMIYHKTRQGKSFLVCLDTKTKKEIWQHSLGAQLQTEDCPIECSDSSIFALTQSAILAFDTQTQVKKNKPYKRMYIPTIPAQGPAINSIHLAKDGKTLYGLNKTLGQLYAFDAQRGSLKWMGQARSGKQCAIIDADKNDIYLKS